MKIITRILTRKVSKMLLGIKFRYTLKKKVIKITNYTIKYRIVYINNIDNGISNPMTFECLGESFFITARSILDSLNLCGEIYLTLGKKLFRLSEHDFIFDKCLFCEDKLIINSNESNNRCSKDYAPPSTFSLVHNATIFVINSIKRNWITSCDNIRVLIIKHSFVQNVCLDDLKYLTYLDLSHNYLENIKISKNIQYCNLSHNNLSWTEIYAKHLDLSYNSLSFFYSNYKFEKLNLSHNPLKVFSANGDLVNISNTKIRNVLCRGIRKLICRNNKNIKLYSTEDVVYLDLNNCNLEVLKLNHNSLEVAKLRNNKLTTLPCLGRLKCLDLSGNKLYCVGKYPAAYMNVSRNPIRHILSSNNFTHMDLSYINVDTAHKTKEYQITLSLKQTIKKKHNFDRIKKIIVSIPRLIFCKFIFVSALNNNLNLENLIQMAISIVDTKMDNHDYFLKVIYHYEKIIKENQCDPSFYCIMVEENKISVKSRNLPLVFSSFVINEIVENDDICIFENIGDWNCFPLLGCTDFIRRRSTFVKPFSIYCYMDIYCSYTKKLEIINDILLYEGGLRDIRVVNDILLDSKCRCDDFENDNNIINLFLKSGSIIPTYDINTCPMPQLEYLTLNTGSLLPTPGFSYTKDDELSHDITTFIFLKIHTTTSRNPITASPYNYIIGVLCKLFQTILFEQHDSQCSVFLGFNRRQGLIFATFIYRILLYKGIRLSIGVVCGNFSIRWSPMFPKLFGFGLNKSARFASMGEGVFCCKCVKFNHKDLMFKSHGKKYMKGFEERFEVFSVHFKHPYKIFM